MLRRLCCLGVLLTAVVALSAPAADEKKKGDKDDKADPAKLAGDKKQAYEKMVTSGELTGRITQWGEGSQRFLTLQVSIRYAVPNLGAINNLANLQRSAAEAARDPNPLNRARRMADVRRQIAENARNAYNVREEHQNVELQLADEVKVRVHTPPPVFDDKGNLRKRTPKELSELKGPDPRLPGYQAEMDSIAQGQTVKVYLAKKKGPARPAARAKDKDDDEKALEDRPQVAMVYILAEPPAAR